jgi:spermidine synthase
MLAASLAHPKPRRVVLLGLGGAALPQLLQKHRPGAAVDAVEIDPAVVTAARRYFGYRPRKQDHVFVQDAARFVARPERRGRYDLVLVDCYGEDFIPPKLQRPSFLRALAGLLAPGGVIVANLWETHRRYQALVRRYAALYPHVWVIPGRRSGNAMLIASRGPRPPFASTKALVKRGERFEARSRTSLPIASHLRRLQAIAPPRPRRRSRLRPRSLPRAGQRARPRPGQRARPRPRRSAP